MTRSDRWAIIFSEIAASCLLFTLMLYVDTHGIAVVRLWDFWACVVGLLLGGLITPLFVVIGASGRASKDITDVRGPE